MAQAAVWCVPCSPPGQGAATKDGVNLRPPTLDLAAATALTGVEPSKILFFQREFHSLFRLAEEAAEECRFDVRELELIRTLDRLIFAEGCPLGEVRRRLAGTLRTARVIAVTSGKGGVGKTTVAINLAVALAAGGRRTLLFDADMGMANVHVFAGINPKRTVVDLLQGRATVGEVLVDGPGGVRVLPGASGLTELADLDPGAMASLVQELLHLGAVFDAIVVDTGAGISSRVVDFLRVADEIVVVAIPDIASMLDAYGVVKVAHEARVKGQIRLLINLVSPPTDPDAVAERIRGCARRFLGCEPTLLGWLAQDRVLQEANQKRQPLLLSQPQSDSAQRLRRMAAALMNGHAPAAAAPAAPPSQPGPGPPPAAPVTRGRPADDPVPTARNAHQGGVVHAGP